MRKKLQILVMLMFCAALFVIGVPTAFMQYPLSMNVITFWIAIGLLADRLGKK